ncbi:MAG TPA: glycosyltransferase [Blastocatellia bacterium]|nr:glycosyltransferase [Blastocatellia bacterium]
MAGIIARYPFGGVTWCTLMYLLGLRALGHEVFYIEDTGECIYDPVQNTISTDSTFGCNYIHDALSAFGLGDRWAFVDYAGNYFGQSKERVQEYCRDADWYLNLSGGSWFWRDEYARIPRKAFIDSDPVFTQLAIAKAEPWYVEFFRGFDHLFTFGQNIGTADCDVPTAPFVWKKTYQPITLEHWKRDITPRDRFTTVMTWKISSFADVDGNKDKEFVKFLALAKRAKQPIELAINGPREFLAEHGWTTVNAMDVSRDLWAYREYLQNSKAEFGVAKHAYVASNSGWFSDRTECYLAAGRPAVVQDTGFSRHLPTGEGLFAFQTPDEALAAIEAVNLDYARHSRCAQEIAREHFDARQVLSELLAACSTSE